MNAAIGDNGRNGSFAAWGELNKTEESQLYINPSDDVGCLSDFTGLEGGEETLAYDSQDWNQQYQSTEGIQIVVQEHIDNQWDAEMSAEIPKEKEVEAIQPRNSKYFFLYFYTCIKINYFIFLQFYVISI